ncbi:MAG: restriction endonuclease subunit S [Acutalibacteraceae bacterium]
MRFKQYHCPWSTYHLSDIAEVVGGGTPDTTVSSLWNGDIQWFTPTEVGHQKYVSKSARTITQLGLQKSSAKKLPAGSILLSSRATIGECSIAQRECTTNQGFQNLIPKKDTNNEFLYYLAQTKKHHFIKYASGSTFLEISNSEIKKTKCTVPGTEEQTQIAAFLSALDDRIAVQNKIIEDLKVLKKELCAKLFGSPLCGRIIAIEQVADIYGGYAFNSKAYVNKGKYKIVTIGNVTGDKYISGNYNTIDRLPNNIQKPQVLSKGDILVSLTGNVGRISIVDGDEYLLNQRVAKLGIEDDLTKEYIYQYLSNSSFEKDMINAGQGAAQKNIKNQDILSYCIRFPTDQTALENIDKLLSLYDIRITSEKAILSNLILQKSYYLRAMFI